MIFLPIVERELRVAARKPVTYWCRLWASVGGVAVIVWILTVLGHFGTPNGALLFHGLAVLLFIYAAIGGMQVTYDSLSRERRESTLGLLFLTDLTGVDIAAGKLAANILNLLYTLLALMPVLALAFLLGAVTPGEMFRAALVALNLMFFFSSVGLAASSLCKQANNSMVLAILFYTLLVGAWPLAALYTSIAHSTLHAALISSPRSDASWLSTPITIQAARWSFALMLFSRSSMPGPLSLSHAGRCRTRGRTKKLAGPFRFGGPAISPGATRSA